MSKAFPEFRVVDGDGEVVCAMQRIETIPPVIRGHRSVIYGELNPKRSYRLVITQANGAFHIIPVKFMKRGEILYLENPGLTLCKDIEFEYDDATSV